MQKRGGIVATVSSPRLDGFLDSMRANGLRITEPRRTIARHLLEHDGHITGDQLVAAVQAEAPEIDPSTVYRFLETSAKLGLTVHSHVGHGPAVHHLADETHAHLICSRCGEVRGVPVADFESLTAAFTERYGFVIRPAHFAVEGLCEACRT